MKQALALLERVENLPFLSILSSGDTAEVGVQVGWVNSVRTHREAEQVQALVVGSRDLRPIARTHKEGSKN